MSPAAPGTGWPDDPATAATPVADGAAAVRALAEGAGTLTELTARQSVCRACPRLVEWRERVAEEKRGGNRTGRIFTGDRSGDVLYASLWRTGLAVQATSIAAGDGQRLVGTRMVAAVRCAPPQNKPSVGERDTCAPWLTAEFAFVADGLRAIVCLGHFAWQAAWPQIATAGFAVPRPRPPFGHGVEVPVARGEQRVIVIGCYHPSQQNTFTGRVTDAMLDEVFGRARRHSGL